MMRNPYSDLPDYAFWRRSVASVASDQLDPVTTVPFTISPEDRVATAGSCFAQHISRTLVTEGFNYHITEAAPLTAAAVNENFGVFPARFGNIYTTRQLWQLFRRVYGLFEPQDDVWRRPDGRLVDAFRPQIQAAGFASEQDLRQDRAAHFLAVARMFEECDVFIFTLGLTECWVSAIDGAVYPVAPGVVGAGRDADMYRFMNLSVTDMGNELEEFIDGLRAVNPDVRIILTVSPVPLIATYEDRHVLVATTYSKSALRVVAEMAVQAGGTGIAYFPSYEIVVGSYARSNYFAPDLRDVTPQGVNHVMRIFKRHFLGAQADQALRSGTGHGHAAAASGAAQRVPGAADVDLGLNDPDNLAAIRAIVCEEEALDPMARPVIPHEP
jgi:hypothetical protein